MSADVVELLAAHRLTTPVQCCCGWRETDGDPASTTDRWAEHVAEQLALAGEDETDADEHQESLADVFVEIFARLDALEARR